MKKMKILALLLALALMLPFAVSCGSAQEGTPNSFPNVTIITTYDSEAEEVTGEEAEEYEETIFEGEVVVYTETETTEITVLDLLYAYAEAKNINLVYDEANNRITKIGEISVGGGYFWNYLVNEKDAGLSTAVTGDDEIQIIFTK